MEESVANSQPNLSAFLNKLYKYVDIVAYALAISMVADRNTDDMIHWSEDGRSFIGISFSFLTFSPFSWRSGAQCPASIFQTQQFLQFCSAIEHVWISQGFCRTAIYRLEWRYFGLRVFLRITGLCVIRLPNFPSIIGATRDIRWFWKLWIHQRKFCSQPAWADGACEEENSSTKQSNSIVAWWCCCHLTWQCFLQWCVSFIQSPLLIANTNFFCPNWSKFSVGDHDRIGFNSRRPNQYSTWSTRHSTG